MYIRRSLQSPDTKTNKAMSLLEMLPSASPRQIR